LKPAVLLLLAQAGAFQQAEAATTKCNELNVASNIAAARIISDRQHSARDTRSALAG
jgi:hypothetical protein